MLGRRHHSDKPLLRSLCGAFRPFIGSTRRVSFGSSVSRRFLSPTLRLRVELTCSQLVSRTVAPSAFLPHRVRNGRFDPLAAPPANTGICTSRWSTASCVRLERRLVDFTHATCSLLPAPQGGWGPPLGAPQTRPLPRGFRHFVTSMPTPVASGWSVRRVGLAPTGKRRLSRRTRIAGLHESPREGLETGRKPAFRSEPAIGFTARSRCRRRWPPNLAKGGTGRNT
jgi:hypothetical protein